MPYDSFEFIPIVVAQDRSLWRDIFMGAHTAPKNIAMFGDSQETNPGGAGNVYVPRLNYELFRIYGETPSTMWSSPSSFSTSTNWLSAGASAGSPYTSTGVVPDTYVLPALSRRGSGTASQGTHVNMLQHDGASLDAGTNLAGVQDYWDQASDVIVDTLCYTRSGAFANDIRLRITRSSSSAPLYFWPEVSSYDSSGLNLTESDNVAKVFSTPAITRPVEGEYLLAAPNAIDQTAGVQFGGMRWRQVGAAGMTIHSFSEGGYRVDSVLVSHANAGSALAATGPYDAVILHFGVNDDSAGRTADEFKTNTEALISAIRGAGWLNDPNVPFILVSDSYWTGGSSEYDQYPGAAAAIAEADDKVMAVNARQISDAVGFNASNSSYWLTDGVHLTAAGSRDLASLVADTIYGYATGGGGLPVAGLKPSMLNTSGDLKAGLVNPTYVGGDASVDQLKPGLISGDQLKPSLQNPDGDLRAGIKR